MTNNKIDLFGVKAKQEVSTDIVTQASGLTNLKPYDKSGKELVAGIIKAARQMIKTIKDHHDPIKRAAKNAHSVACQKEKETLAPIEAALQKAQSILDYVANDERQIEHKKRQEAEEKAREEAKKKREAFGEKMTEILAKAEGITDQIKLVEEALEEATDEESAMLRRKLTMLNTQLEEGEQAAAETQYEAEEPVYIAPVETQVTAGVSKSIKVSVEVKSLKDLCKAIGDGIIPVAAVKPAMSKLNGYARDGMPLPGCIINRTAKAIVR